MVYEILGEVKHFPLLFANFPYCLELGAWTDKGKDLETRIDFILNIEMLIPFDGNGI